MKKRLLLVVVSLVVFCLPAFSAGDFGVSLSFDFLGLTEVLGVDFDMNSGFTLGLSYAPFLNEYENIRLGFGASIWLPRNDEDGDSFSALAVYVATQVYPRLLPNAIGGLYSKMNLGFNTLIASDVDDLEGGLYAAWGIGWEFKNGLFLEWLYNRYYWKINGASVVMSDNISFTLGYRF